MKSISKPVKRTIIFVCIVLTLCVAFFFLLMLIGLFNYNIAENYSHVISVENIDPNRQQIGPISYQPLILDNGTSVNHFADCTDISRSLYLQASNNQDILYLDNGELLCTFPVDVLQKNNNSVCKGKYLLCIGQKWKSLGPMNSIDQPTRRHKNDYVFKVDVLNGKMDVVFESKAKERVLYADFNTIITYYDGEILYYNLTTGEIFKTVDAAFMKKRQKYTISCNKDTLMVTTKSGQIAEIKIS
jgi:hypothetical protein